MREPIPGLAERIRRRVADSINDLEHHSRLDAMTTEDIYHFAPHDAIRTVAALEPEDRQDVTAWTAYAAAADEHLTASVINKWVREVRESVKEAEVSHA